MIDYRLATTRAERAAAFRLVYTAYLQSGLGTPNPHEMRVTPYHLLPTSEVFIAVLRGTVVLTFSLAVDGELGLPMDSVYGGEVAQLRDRGLRLGEVTCLADRRREFVGFRPTFLRLSGFVVQYSRQQGLDGLVVAVHPKHAEFYRRFMGFEVIGEKRGYPTVRNRPAVALHLDFASLARKRPRCHKACFAHRFSEEQLLPQPISEGQREYFGAMVDPAFVAVPLGDLELEREHAA